MIKTCPTCGREFDAKYDFHIYCSRKCQYQSWYTKNRKRARWFAREWKTWKRDFALGKTQSNL